MYARKFAMLLVAGIPVLFASAPQPMAGQQRSELRKERTAGAGTPGVLLPLRAEPPTYPTIDASHVTASAPDVWDVDPASGAQYRRGELLVQFRNGASSRIREQAVRSSGAVRVGRGTMPANWELVEVERGQDVPRAMAALRRQLPVRRVALNYRVTTQQVRPNDESYDLQWNFDAINLPNAWQINPGARNDVVVAVIDTGLNTFDGTVVFSSPFVGQIPVRFAIGPDVPGEDRILRQYDFIYEDDLPVDLSGHGTHVAGTIAQQTNNNIGVAGIAYNVKLMPLKVISGGAVVSWDDVFFPGNRGGTLAILVEAIAYAADNGAKIINLSLGGIGEMEPVRDAIEYAVGRGAFVAIAAGNGGDDGNPVEYPAAYAPDIKGAMAVGAVNRSLRRSTYSTFHPYVEICAPGGEIRSLVDYERGITQVGYEEAATLSFFDLPEKIAALLIGFRPRFDRFELRPFQGTSMATPHVSGVAALLYSQGIRSPAAIEEAIKRFATPIDATPEECGAGLVDARRALRGLGLGR